MWFAVKIEILFLFMLRVASFYGLLHSTLWYYKQKVFVSKTASHILLEWRKYPAQTLWQRSLRQMKITSKLHLKASKLEICHRYKHASAWLQI